jgi:hypothetical protein
MRTLISWLGAISVLMPLPACTPSLNWRDVRPAGAELRMMFPCKPEVFSRAAELPAAAGEMLRAGLAVCEVGGRSFSLSWSDVGEPTQVSTALRLMRERLSLKLGASVAPLQPLLLPGATPNEFAGRFSLQMHSSEGRPQAADGLVFARGSRVYQLLMMGGQPSPAVWASFAGGIRLVEP